MMRMSTKNDVLPPQMNGEKKWELRPGGMLVQKRTEADQNKAPPPLTIRVRVKYGSIYHEIYISSQATFGELKKMLTGPTGLHHQDQKLFYKDKERDSKAFLDTVGVKDKSKLVLQEDAISQEKRILEMRKNAKIEKAAKFISDISLEVDRLAGQVSALESIILKGGKVVEKDLVNLTESLMNQLIKLDGINADGDVKLQRKMQVTRVQKYVETLDVLKAKNSTPRGNGIHVPSKQQQQTPNLSQQPQRHSNETAYSPVQQQKHSNGNISFPVEKQQRRHSFGLSLIDSPIQEEQPSRHSASSGADVVITTQWETFDSTPAEPFTGAPSTSSSTLHSAQPSFKWDLL